MSRNIIIVLMYHRHKLLDLIYISDVSTKYSLQFKNNLCLHDSADVNC
jgi:hypothetical protein